MRSGYLYVTTHTAQPGTVSLGIADQQPLPEQFGDGLHLHYVARFNDVEAARMHAHEVLKRKLVDIDAHRYRASLVQALVAVEAVELRHERVWQDPGLAWEDLHTVTTGARARHYRHLYKDKIWQLVGAAALCLLALRALGIF